MSHRHITRPLRRTALALVLGAALAHGSAFAQSTSGDIAGTAPVAPGETVQITSLNSGVTRQVAVDASGRFRAASLPAGTYSLTLTDADGQTSVRNVTVVAGQTATAAFTANSDTSAKSLDTVVVTGTNLNAIDLSSVESRTTFSADQLNSLPVGRDITSVALLTPGTVSASGYFGPASFGGASAAENSYYVNGFNTTNLYDSLSFSEVPFQAIDQLDVQTGGYGAQYGFSTGGVTSVNVKHGTNEWKGGVAWTGTPDSLRDHQPHTNRADGQGLRSYANNYSSSNDYTAWIGGPLIKDKLFIFALGQFSQDNSTSYAARSGTSATSVASSADDYESKTPYWLVKLDWYLNDWNHFEYTGFDNSSRSTTDSYNAAYDSTASGAEASKTGYYGQLVNKSGGQTDIFKWTSNLTDDLTASIQYGQSRSQSSQLTISPDGTRSSYDGDIFGPVGNCPYVYSYAAGGQLGCAVTDNVNLAGGHNKRTGTRVDFDWQLGDHKVGFGYSDEKWKSKSGSSNASGAYYTYFDDDPTETPYVEDYNFRTGGSIEIDQKSWYVDDHWQVTDNLMLYGGIRNDLFENKNSDGVTFVKQDNIWQPRLGFAWDILGNGRDKLFGSLGRYSLPIAANVALRAASASYYTLNYYTYDGIDPVNGAPINPVPLDGGANDQVVNGEDGSTPDPKAVASKGLKPYTQDEAILGYQHQVVSDIAFLNDWTVGIKGTYRRINKVIDDTCDTRKIYQAAQADGYDMTHWDEAGGEWSLPSGLPGCYLYNPGEDLDIALDVDGDGTPDNIHVDGSALGPKAKRYYKAVTLSADKSTDTWYVSASYTWSKLNGNYEGLVKSTNGQSDTGTTSDFDFAEIMYGADGDLFNDHRHSFKVFGGYKFNKEWAVGANLLVQSGAPISCLGGGFGSFGTEYGYSGVFHTCNAGLDDIAELGTAGRTPWTVSFSPNLNYTPSWLPGLSAQLSVLNAFNTVKPLQVYETKFTQNSAGTIVNYQNYKSAKYYTDPRMVRLQLQYDF